MKKYLLFLIFLLNSPSFAMQEAENSANSKQETTKNFSLKEQALRFGKFAGQVALAAGISYCNIFLNTFFHELGHAVTTKFMLGGQLTLYLGGHPDSSEAQPGIHIIGYNPYFGKIFKERGSDWQDAIIFAAGPLTGIIATVMTHYILKNQKYLPELTKKLCIDYNYGNYIVNIHNLLPWSCYHSDGGKIAHILNLLDFNFLGRPINHPQLICILAFLIHPITFHILMPIKNLYTCYKYYPE